MLTQRQLLILQLIIQLYTETLEPIGSKTLMQSAELPYSSATIRNEMMKLEELGYLEKNHTSSGRIPSNKGYRYFIDYILPQQKKQMSSQVRNQIRASFQRHGYEIKDLFRLSADILATLTNYTTISIGPEVRTSHLTGFRIVRLSPTQVMSILVTDKGFVENKVSTIPSEVREDDLERVVKIINDELVGLPLATVVIRLKTDIPRLMQRYLQSQIQLIYSIQEMMQQFEDARLHVAGKQHLLNLVDSYSDIEQLKTIYQLMDDSQVVQELIATQQQGIQVRLGPEIENPIFGDFSVITASYETPSQGTGLIALLGPKNMPYSKVISIIHGLRDELNITMDQYYQQKYRE